MRCFIFISSLLAFLLGQGWPVSAASHPNVLIITVDDMSCDSIGVFGCELEETSPHVDRLAARSLRFEHAHTVVGNCKPSRNVMWSGRYPHNNGVEGFYSNNDPDYPVLCDLMKAHGYFTGIRGKASHSTPYYPYAWDIDLDTLPDGTKAHIKDIESYHTSTAHGITSAKEAGKPFCLLINISDPHKPFYGVKGKDENFDDPHKPTRVFSAEEVPVPRFLPDDPAIREELAKYYSSVRRADDCVGAALRALKESGQEEDTFILFLSDHGMPLPFAKTQVYHHSTRTPLIVHWPGVTEAGAVDKRHMVSAVDFVPTLLDVVEAPHPEGLDGRSFAALLKGETQKNRNMIFKVYNENAGGQRTPMRSVETREYVYIFNPWSDGERIMTGATMGTASYRRMQALAKTDEYIAGRVRLFNHRILEELYDTREDRDGLHNLADDPDHAEEIARLRKALEKWMVRTGDPALEAMRGRGRRATLDAYMTRLEAEAAARKKDRRKKNPKKKTDKKAGNKKPQAAASPGAS